MSFKNKTIWITGASSGIGEALAQAFATEGATLILSARRESELARVRAACANADKHLVLPLDLTDFDPDTILPLALAHSGQIALLVNSGGISQRSAVIDTEMDVHRRIMEVNYFGTIAMTRMVLPHMLARKSGHIVTVSSVVGKFGTARRSAYAASKHALHGYYDALRAEVYGEGIRVTVACPGFVRTNISVNALRGDGSTYNKVDSTQSKGLSAEECAAQILRAVAREKAEVYIGREGWAVHLNRLFPRLFTYAIRRVRRT